MCIAKKNFIKKDKKLKFIILKLILYYLDTYNIIHHTCIIIPLGNNNVKQKRKKNIMNIDLSEYKNYSDNDKNIPCSLIIKCLKKICKKIP